MYLLLYISPQAKRSGCDQRTHPCANALVHKRAPMPALHESPRHDALPHFDLSFQSRTAEVCLACPTTPCRTKTSYHSLQESQGASALIHVCLHIWAAKTALLPCLHAAGCMFFLRLWRSWDSLERSLIISWCLGGLPKTWGTLGGEVHSSSLRIQGALIPQPLCISQFCESTHVIYPSHYSVAI
jgi:hypothetical protein